MPNVRRPEASRCWLPEAPSALSRAPSARPCRSRRRWSRIAPGSSAATTERADASEISCSLERPPASTATRTRRFTESSWSRPSSSPTKRPTKRVMIAFGVGLRPADRVLCGHDSVLSGVEDVLQNDSRPEARVLESRLRDGDVHGRDVRNGGRRWSSRDVHGHRRSPRALGPAARRLARDGSLGLVGVLVEPRHDEAGALELGRRLVVRQPDDARNRHRSRPLRDVDPHLRAFDDDQCRRSAPGP